MPYQADLSFLTLEWAGENGVQWQKHLSVPNGGDVKRRLGIADWPAPNRSRNSLNPVSPPEHIDCFNRASIIRMADVAGLEIVKIPLSILCAYNTNWRPYKTVLQNV